MLSFRIDFFMNKYHFKISYKNNIKFASNIKFLNNKFKDK